MEYSPSENLCYPNLGSFLLITCLLMTPFSIRKALLPHMSTFLLIIWTLTPFAARKASLSHMSSFLLIAFPFLAQISIEKTFVTIWDLFYWLHALYWHSSPSVTPYELFSANYMPFTGPGFIKKPFLHEYELVLLTTCPSLTLFPAKVALLLDVSSFMLMTCPVLSPFPTKKHCYPTEALFC